MKEDQREFPSMEKRELQYRKILKKSPLLYKTAAQVKKKKRDTEPVSVSYVLVPSLINFVSWALEEAEKKGIKRLYFLARDGYLMYLAASRLCEKWKLPIQCRYLYCSRYSVRIPLFHLDMRQALELICRRGLLVTPEKIMERAGLTGEEGKKILEDLDLPYSPDSCLSHDELKMLKDRLFHCGDFLESVKKHSMERFQNFCGYIKQEGLLEEIPSAFVDSGWLGSMQELLNEACALLGRKSRIEGFYWGLYELPRQIQGEEYHCFFFSPFHGLINKLYFNNCLFEAVFTAPHGMTLGYVKKEGYQPVLGVPLKERHDFLMNFADLLEEYIKALPLGCTLPALGKEALKSRKIIRKLFYLLTVQPTIEEAEFFGSFLFSDEVLEGQEHELAPPLSPDERISPGKTVWYEGSIVRGRKKTAFSIQGYLFYKACRLLFQMVRQVKK